MVESPPAPDGYRRLTPLGWRLGLAATLAGLVVSFFAFGFFNPYWRTADQDVLLVYDAFLQNDGLPRQVVLHPAHLIVTLISATLRGLHGLGLIATYSLSTLPPASDVAAFHHAWTVAVRVARLICLLLVLSYVTAFGLLLRRLTGDWRAALLGAFAVAYSGGISVAVRAVKPELISSALAALALLILLVAAREARNAARPLLVGAAAAIATLGMVNKVQAIFLICALPILLLPFGERSDGGGYWGRPRAAIPIVTLAIAVALAVAAAWPVLMQGLFPDPPPDLMRGMFGSGQFQLLLAVWLGLGMVAFAVLWRVPWPETLATALAIVTGIAVGLLPLHVHNEALPVAIVLNPANALAYFGDISQNGCSQGCTVPFVTILRGFVSMLKAHSFVFHTSTRPTIFLEWAVVAGAIWAWRRGERKIVLQVALLIGAALGIDTFSATRALKIDYFHFADPLIVIAAALLIARVPGLQRHKWLYPAGALLLVAHGVMSQLDPVKEAFLRRAGPETKCVFLNQLQRLERFPFCTR
ncbi:MAG: hypothetical protein AB7O50_03855 [Pseudolabrys sp.]